jgi:DNA-directed RNA polymerase specialized sigma24 family protein
MAMRRGARQLPSVGAGTGARDQQWWDGLVECHSQQLWRIARGSGLDASEAADVLRLVWLRLADHVTELPTDNQIREWVCAVADREARLAVARQRAPATQLGGSSTSLGRLGA